MLDRTQYSDVLCALHFKSQIRIRISDCCSTDPCGDYMTGPVQKTCEACGCEFECGQYGCWCGKIGITEAQMDWIATRFHDCLCPECLEKVARGQTELLKPLSAPQAERR